MPPPPVNYSFTHSNHLSSILVIKLKLSVLPASPRGGKPKSTSVPYQSARCHFGAAWYWKPIHNWSRDRLNVEPVPPCAARSHHQHNWRQQLLCCYATAGKSWGVLFSRSLEGSVIEIDAQREQPHACVWLHLSVWEDTRHSVPTIFFTTLSLLGSPEQKVTTEKHILTRVGQVFNSPPAQWNKWNGLCCGPRLKC